MKILNTQMYGTLFEMDKGLIKGKIDDISED